MKNIAFRWWLAVFGLLSLQGCGGDGGNGEADGTVNATASETVTSLVGSWIINNQNGHVEIDTFKSDGTMEGRIFQSTNGTFTLIKLVTATYAVNSDTVTVVFEGKTITGTFTISDDLLTVTVTSELGSGEVFTYARYTGELATVTKTVVPIGDAAEPTELLPEIAGRPWWFEN